MFFYLRNQPKFKIKCCLLFCLLIPVINLITAGWFNTSVDSMVPEDYFLKIKETLRCDKNESHFYKKTKFTKKEVASFVYNYVINITEVEYTNILPYLRHTLWKEELPPDLDICKIKDRGRGFPCLIPSDMRIHYKNKYWKGVPLPVLTSIPRGRLGNIMGEYASLYALGHLYNMSVFVHPTMKENLEGIFPHLSLPVLPISLRSACSSNNITKVENTNEWIDLEYIMESTVDYSLLELAASGLLGPRLFRVIDYPFEMQLFNTLREDILTEFTFAASYMMKAHEFLSRVALERANKWSITFIGFHMRRTDYLTHIKTVGGSLPGVNYYKEALHYYRVKFPHPVFIASSDDPKHMKNALKGEKDIYFVEEEDPVITMAILSACNHSIITTGTYGFWTGYFTRGEVIYPGSNYSKPYQISKKHITESKIDFFHAIDP